MSDSESSCSECSASHPPRGAGLDALARALESDGVQRTASGMIALEHVLGAEALSGLAAQVARFYANPLEFQVSAAIRAGAWSRLLLFFIALFGRQAQLAPGPAGERYPVCQWLYVDGRGRTHWDRYVCVRGSCRRLFTARMEASRGRLCETFVIYGLPAALTFRASVQDGALSLVLLRTLSPLSWFARVSYRSEPAGAGVHTRGSFRVPLLGMHVETEFRALRRSPA